MASRSLAVATAVARRFLFQFTPTNAPLPTSRPREVQRRKCQAPGGCAETPGHAPDRGDGPGGWSGRPAGPESPPKRPYTARTGLLAMRCLGLSRLSSDVFLGEPPILALATFSKWGWGGVMTRFSGCDAVVGGFWGRPEDLLETGKALGIFYLAATFVCEGIIIP